MSEKARLQGVDRQAGWNALRTWVAERGHGRWTSLGDAARFCGLEPVRAARTLAMLGHLELSWGLGRWSAAPACLVALTQPHGRLWLTGAITAGLPDRVDAALAKHGVDAAVLGPFHEGGRGPSAWHVEARPEHWRSAARAAGLPLVLDAPMRLARRLPSAEPAVIGSAHQPDDRFPAAPIDTETLRPAWGRPVEVDVPAMQLLQGGRPVWWIRHRDGSATRLPSGEWAVWMTQDGRPRIAHDPDGTLRVDAATPLPPLHARTACLTTGRLPARAHAAPDIAEDRYRAVPSPVADIILATLRPAGAFAA